MYAARDMETLPTEQDADARKFLQLRVALFGKVMVVLYVLGGCAHIAFSPDGYLQAWFALYVLTAAVTVVAWLLCRSIDRSLRFSRSIEALMLLLGGAGCWCYHAS